MGKENQRDDLSWLVAGVVYFGVSLVAIGLVKAGKVPEPASFGFWAALSLANAAAMTWGTKVLRFQGFLAAGACLLGAVIGGIVGNKMAPGVSAAQLTVAGGAFGVFGALAIGNLSRSVRLVIGLRIPAIALLGLIILLDAAVNGALFHAGAKALLAAVVIPVAVAGGVFGGIGRAQSAKEVSAAEEKEAAGKRTVKQKQAQEAKKASRAASTAKVAAQRPAAKSESKKQIPGKKLAATPQRPAASKAAPKSGTAQKGTSAVGGKKAAAAGKQPSPVSGKPGAASRQQPKQTASSPAAAQAKKKDVDIPDLSALLNLSESKKNSTTKAEAKKAAAPKESAKTSASQSPTGKKPAEPKVDIPKIDLDLPDLSSILGGKKEEKKTAPAGSASAAKPSSSTEKAEKKGSASEPKTFDLDLPDLSSILGGKKEKEEKKAEPAAPAAESKSAADKGEAKSSKPVTDKSKPQDTDAGKKEEKKDNGTDISSLLADLDFLSKMTDKDKDGKK